MKTVVLTGHLEMSQEYYNGLLHTSGWLDCDALLEEVAEDFVKLDDDYCGQEYDLGRVRITIEPLEEEE